MQKEEKSPDEIGFGWWLAYGWLGLILGTALLLLMASTHGNGVYLFLIVLNGFVCVFILQYSRLAFLTATILSCNPIVWVINGVYLKNRWTHPKVVAGSGRSKVADLVPREAATPKADVPKLPIRIQSDPSDEHFRLAGQEVDEGRYDKGVWERLFTEADGDLNKTRARYVGKRAKELATDANHAI